MPLGRYGARHIARWSVSVALCEATRCRHRACARAVSARRTPWSSSSPSYENTEIRTKNTSASDYTIIFSIEQWPVKSVMIFRKSHNIWKMLFLYEKTHWRRTQFFSCGGIKYVMYLFLCICPGKFLPPNGGNHSSFGLICDPSGSRYLQPSYLGWLAWQAEFRWAPRHIFDWKD